MSNRLEYDGASNGDYYNWLLTLLPEEARIFNVRQVEQQIASRKLAEREEMRKKLTLLSED